MKNIKQPKPSSPRTLGTNPKPKTKNIRAASNESRSIIAAEGFEDSPMDCPIEDDENAEDKCSRRRILAPKCADIT